MLQYRNPTKGLRVSLRSFTVLQRIPHGKASLLQTGRVLRLHYPTPNPINPAPVLFILQKKKKQVVHQTLTPPTFQNTLKNSLHEDKKKSRT